MIFGTGFGNAQGQVGRVTFGGDRRRNRPVAGRTRASRLKYRWDRWWGSAGADTDRTAAGRRAHGDRRGERAGHDRSQDPQQPRPSFISPAAAATSVARVRACPTTTAVPARAGARSTAKPTIAATSRTSTSAISTTTATSTFSTCRVPCTAGDPQNPGAQAGFSPAGCGDPVNFPDRLFINDGSGRFTDITGGADGNYDTAGDNPLPFFHASAPTTPTWRTSTTTATWT